MSIGRMIAAAALAVFTLAGALPAKAQFEGAATAAATAATAAAGAQAAATAADGN